MTSGVYVINTPSRAFTASLTGTLVHSPLLLGTNIRTSLTPYPLHTLSSECEKITPSDTRKVKGNCNYTPTHILVTTPLSYTLPFYIQVQMGSSWDIKIPPSSLSTLNRIPAASREIFIATLTSMRLHYTQKSPCLLVPSRSNEIPLDSNNQALHHLKQISV